MEYIELMKMERLYIFIPPENTLVDLTITKNIIYEITTDGTDYFVTQRSLNSRVLSLTATEDLIKTLNRSVKEIASDNNNLYSFTKTKSTQTETLIPITTLDQFNAMRYDLDGDGVPTGTADEIAIWNEQFPSSIIDAAATYDGYAQQNDLDFAGSIWADGGSVTGGFPPMGAFNTRLECIFDGAGHTISNLYIDTSSGEIGLFANIGEDGVLTNLGIEGGSVNAAAGSGIFAARNSGEIRSCYTTADIGGVLGTGSMVGNNLGLVIDCYANGNVTSTSIRTGGLVGLHSGAGRIVNSLFRGTVVSATTSFVGGVAGLVADTATITNSYYDTTIGGVIGGVGAHTTAELQNPTSATGIYDTWDADVWNFGTSTEYPTFYSDLLIALNRFC